MVQDISSELEYCLNETTGRYEEQQTLCILPLDVIHPDDRSTEMCYSNGLDQRLDRKRLKLNGGVRLSVKERPVTLVQVIFRFQGPTENEEDNMHMDDVESREKKQRPRLNDLVEIYGSVCEDYVDSFSNLASSVDVKSVSMNMESYRILDLDSYVAKNYCLDNRKRVFDYGISDREVVIEAFAHHLFCGCVVSAEALLLALLSKAECKGSSPTRMQNDSYSVGCTSLNLVLNNESECASFYSVLKRAIAQLFPATQMIDSLRLDEINSGRLLLPGKRNEESPMRLSKLQNVRGTTLLLNASDSISQKVARQKLNQTGLVVLRSLSSISTAQNLDYSFGPYFSCKFDADYRTIILSTVSSANLFGDCLLTMRLAGPVSTYPNNDRQLIFPTDLASKIRLYFARCRNLQNVNISQDICDKAAHHFVNRRKLARSEGAMAITEKDFHRWLTITRLQARSQALTPCCTLSKTTNATLNDWKSALKLDQNIVATFRSAQISPM